MQLQRADAEAGHDHAPVGLLSGGEPHVSQEPQEHHRLRLRDGEEELSRQAERGAALICGGRCRHWCGGGGTLPKSRIASEVTATETRLACSEATLPGCANCAAVARPNILMFGDSGWLPDRTVAQQMAMKRWLGGTEPLVVLCIGAGSDVPTCRLTAEAAARQSGAKLIRINPREPSIPADLEGVELAMGAAEALAAIDAAIGSVTPA